MPAPRREVPMRSLGCALWIVMTLAACGAVGAPSDAAFGDLTLQDVDVTEAAPTACHADRECSSLGYVCDRTRGVCVECVTAADCLGAARACSGGRCISVTRCMSTRQCPSQVCNTMLGYCVDCNIDDDCTGGNRCRGNRC